MMFMENHAKRGSNTCASYRGSRFTESIFANKRTIILNRAATSFSQASHVPMGLSPPSLRRTIRRKVYVAERKTHVRA